MADSEDSRMTGDSGGREDEEENSAALKYRTEFSEESSTESPDLSSASQEVSSVYKHAKRAQKALPDVEAALNVSPEDVEMNPNIPPPVRFIGSTSDAPMSPMSTESMASPLPPSPRARILNLGEGDSPSDMVVQHDQLMEMSPPSPPDVEMSRQQERETQTSTGSDDRTLSAGLSISDLPDLPFDSPKRTVCSSFEGPSTSAVVEESSETTSPQKAGPSKKSPEKKSPKKKGKSKKAEGDIEMQEVRSEGKPLAVPEEQEKEKKKKEAKKKSEKDAGKRSGSRENK